MEGESGQFIVNLTCAWKTNIVLIITGLCFSFLFMKLMSECARCLAMTAIAIMLLSYFGGGLACLFMATKSKEENQKYGLLATGGILIVLGLCTLLCLWCYRKSLETAIAIIDATADFLIDTKRLILVSIWSFFVTMVIFFLWLFAVASVFSMVEFNDPSPPGSQVKEIKEPIPGKVWGMFGFLAFGYLWMT